MPTPVSVLVWTVVGVFVFTAAATCLSLIGLIKFRYPEQQRRLFQALILEVVVFGVGAVGGIYVDPTPKGPASEEARSGRGREAGEEPGRDHMLKEPGPALPSGSSSDVRGAEVEAVEIPDRPNRELVGPIASFHGIEVGQQILVRAKQPDTTVDFPLYDSKPQLFGRFGKQVGVLPGGTQMLVLDKHVTPLRGFKWLRVQVDDGRSGWYSWENVRSQTYEVKHN